MTQRAPRYSLHEAIERALAERDDAPEECLRTVQGWYGIDPASPSAVEAWESARLKHPGDVHPPRGAPVFWSGGSAGFGHIAMSLGPIDGAAKIRSTDAGGYGVVGTVLLDWPSRSWGLHYLGWSADLEGVPIPGRAPAPHPTPKPHPEPKPKPNPKAHPDPTPHGIPAAPDQPLKLGDAGDHVKAWQLKMRERGFVDLVADGRYGNTSFLSCRWFQLYLHLTATGEVDQALWRSTWSDR
jgi:hypothetical protein